MKADFYIDNNGDMTWLGSIFEKGLPWDIPMSVLIQMNPTMFTEKVSEYFDLVNHTDRNWPWPWSDSRTTDYSYILDCEIGKVVAYSAREKMIFDPIKVSVGEDLSSSKIANAIPNFPTLGADNGQKPSKTVSRIRKLFKL